MSIVDNLSQIETALSLACQAANRARNSVRLLAVTKTVLADRVNQAIAAGVSDIGENRVPEAEGKFPNITGTATRHLIGHLQSNKARRAVELFDWIHSIDSIKLAERVDRIAGELSRRIVVLAQVDLGKEATKTGVDVAELPALADYLVACQHLEFRGLMTVPPFFDDAEQARPYFRQLRELLDQLNQQRQFINRPLTELSMGMSHDFTVAIGEGATIVRIGTAIFGVRPTP